MKTFQFFIITFLLFLIVSCKPDGDESIIKNLDQAAISSIEFDKSNTMYVGTNMGLYKAVKNGYKNVYFDVTTQINTLKFDERANVLWIGTNTGLTKLINAESTTGEAEMIASNKLSSDTIKSIHIDLNSISWFGGQKGLTRNNSDIWQKANYKLGKTGVISAAAFESVGINSIAVWDGDYYIATNGRYLYRCSGWDETLDAFSGATQCQAPWNGSSITDTMNVVFVDSKERHWMAGNNGVQMHTGHDSKSNITAFNNDEERVFDNLRVRTIAEAPNGNIWIGTEDGIYIFNESAWIKSTITLPHKCVTAIAFDITGKVWIGTKKGLVSAN